MDIKQYVKKNKEIHEGVAYLKTSVAQLATELGVSESKVKRDLAKLVKEKELIKITKRGNNGGIALFDPKDIDKLKLVSDKLKNNQKLMETLFPKEGTYEPTGARRNKQEMEAYRAEQLEMEEAIRHDNQVFQAAINKFKGYDYNETFAKVNNSEEVYRVFLASRVYDTYAYAFDKRYVEWYKQDKELGDKVKYTRGRSRLYHTEFYHSLKIPFIGTRSYTYAKKLVDCADELGVSVPAYVYNVMERYAWKNAMGYSKPYVPSLNQITDKNHYAMIKKFKIQREYDWLTNGHQYSYTTLEDTNVMYAVKAYMLYSKGFSITPNDIHVNISQTDDAVAYGRFYDYAMAEVAKLDIPEDDKYWYYQYVKEQVALATGSINRAYKRVSPILAYLVSAKGGVMDAYKQWVEEDGGVATQAAQDLFHSTAKDLKTGYEPTRELYEQGVLDNLDDMIDINKHHGVLSIKDVYGLELTRSNHYAKVNVQEMIKTLIPILRLSSRGFINREEIKKEFLNDN